MTLIRYAIDTFVRAYRAQRRGTDGLTDRQRNQYAAEYYQTIGAKPTAPIQAQIRSFINNPDNHAARCYGLSATSDGLADCDCNLANLRDHVLPKEEGTP